MHCIRWEDSIGGICKKGYFMLYSYKMTNDCGFAPNPFYGVMTLATCKKLIRLNRNPADNPNLFIAGFSSVELNGDPVGHERLVFIMKVSRRISFTAYFNSSPYQIKKLDIQNGDWMNQQGDNLYCSANNECGFERIHSINHCNNNSMIDDWEGKNVLISREFFYFGSEPLIIENHFKINIPRGRHPYGLSTEDCKDLWQFLKDNKQSNVLLHPPTKWKAGENFKL